MRAAAANTGVRDAATDPTLRAALSILLDLVAQGWDLRLLDDGGVAVRMPRAIVDPAVEKRSRVRECRELYEAQTSNYLKTQCDAS